MNLVDFIKSKKIMLLLHILGNLLVIYFGLLRRDEIQGLIIILIGINIFFVFYFVMYYLQMKRLINRLTKSEQNLDKKFLIKDIQQGMNYEEELIFDVIDKISKSQYNDVKYLRNQIKEEKADKILWVHEIKQPLAILNGENVSEFNRKKAVNRINKNLNWMLNYEKINQMGSDVNFSNVNILEIINQSIQTFSYELVEINPKLSIKINQNECVFTDKFWLKFVIEQLISNAIKYRNEKQLELQFVVEKNEDKLKLKITDNGIGIEPHDLKNIFDQGYRGSNAKQLIQASGYGLYYVKNVINKLNARISIINNINETGITIIIEFTQISKTK